MARFYGTIQGNRGEATRLGHAAGGLRVSAQSYSGSVVVNLYELGGEDHVRIAVGEGSTSYGGKTLYAGPISQLIDQSARRTLLTALALDVPVQEAA